MKNESKLTWKAVVKEALGEIGTSGHLDDIYSKIKGTRKPKQVITKKFAHLFPEENDLSGVSYLKNLIFLNNKFLIDIGRFQQCFNQMHPYSTICGGSPN